MSDQNTQDTAQNIPVNSEDTNTTAADTNGTENEAVIEPEIMTDEEIAAQEAEEASQKADDAAQAPEESVQPAEDADAPKEPDWKDSYIRLLADFENYRKRTSKEQDDIRKRERERVINAWLDVYDNAERALAALPEKEGPWYEGFSSLIQQMDKCLAAFNIKPADDLGQKFDLKRHEVIATLPNPAMENNTIMHVERRGFVYENGDVARIARVIVVKNPS